MKLISRFGRFAPLVLAFLLILSGCNTNSSALNPVGKNAKMQADLMLLSLGIMLLVILAVMVIFFYVIIRFRKRKDDDSIPEQVEGNTKLEIIWTVIPIILIIIIAIPTVYQVFVLADDRPSASEIDKENAIRIKVTAHQYWWQFEYPDLGIQTATDLYVPTGKKVYVELTSKDVIHSFWVPTLFGKQDANPGLVNRMWFEVPKEGVYLGQCAELCGASHALMDFSVVALSPDKFEAWKKEMKKGADEPKTAEAKQGRKIFKQQCLRCHAIGKNGGNVGPNLAAYGERTMISGILEYNKKNLKNWILNAPKYKADILMPSFSDGSGAKLTEQQADALAEYLMQQKTGIELPQQ
ncbi:MAG TPA: cytochrome c oxidase subunit II [Bacillales bacterium]|nr:cytochrome c oxidase subunit II [Bacillales bacterium]